MSTVRINDDIKEQVIPILDELGISLSEAINMFLHQIKINNGIPFELRRKSRVEVNDGYGSYICEYGHLHDYKKANIADDDAIIDKSYNSAEEMIKDIIDEE